LDAVNVLLAAIGEQPVTDIVSSTSADVQLAVDIIKRVSVAVQAEGWRFNTEFGYELVPAGTTAWVGSDGSTATLNVWKIPASLLSFCLTQNSQQLLLDMMPKRSIGYLETALTVMVFWDRKLNREGLDSSRYTKLYIDPVWLLPFADMPTSAQQYIVQRAGRMFAQRVVGSTEVAGFSAQEEALALRILKRQESIDDDLNIIENSDTLRIWNGRRVNTLFALDGRSSPAKV